MSTKKSRLKTKQIVDVLEDEGADEREEKLRQQKIHAPITWSNIPKGIVIQDIMESRFKEVKEFIKESYMPNDLLCKNSYILYDDVSVKDFLNEQMILLRDKCSICAIEEATNRLAGILILRVFNKDDFGKVHSRVKLSHGDAYKKIRKINDYINRKSDVFTKFNCETYLRIYLLAVHDDFRRKGIGLQMLRASMDVCRSLDIPVLMGIFATQFLQKKAKKIGLEEINEIYYVDWVEKGEIIFSDPGAGNYTLSLMAGKVLPLT